MTLRTRPEAWLPRPRPSAAARLLLYAFPHAGGGASAFAAWPPSLPAAVELRAVQPPGRESRFREAPFRRMEELVRAVLEALRATMDRPVALFGHSLGALVAHAVALELERSGLRPARLLVSAHRAPHLPPRAELSRLPSPALRAALGALNGTSPAVLGNDELMEVLEPALRADFEIDETYRPAPAGRLACPITVLCGARDRSVNDAELEAWSAHTSAGCELVRLPGDHFTLYDPEQLPREVARALERDLAALL